MINEQVFRGWPSTGLQITTSRGVIFQHLELSEFGALYGIERTDSTYAMMLAGSRSAKKVLSALKFAFVSVGLTLFVAIGTASATPISVPLAGEYLFNNTLSSNNGAPALIATNPVGTPGFSIDTVFGTSRTVYSYTGNTSSPSAEGGLTLDTTGLLGSNALWSAEIDFKFNPGGSNWRRIIDVQNRSSDDGFYVDPGDRLIIYPDQVTSTREYEFTTGDYNRVFIAVGSGSASFWLGTSSRTTTATSVMAINNPGNLLNLFLDNTGDYGTDWASGSIAYFALYNGTLNDSDVAQLAARPLPDGVPEPGTVSLLGIAFSAIGIALRRARA